MDSGVLNLIKPPGMTSHDVVDLVRRVTGMKRVGHTGTLDPGAAGVLPVCIGKATRLAEYISSGSKSYRAEVAFGVSTSTQDASGSVVATKDASALSADEVTVVLVRFCGEIEQRVPALSARKTGGVRFYDIARAGGTPEERRTKVTIYRIEMRSFKGGRIARAILDVECSAGTYIRTLCADLGDALGYYGHMSFLVRTRVGGFRLDDAMTLGQMAEAVQRGRMSEIMVSISDALSFIPGVVLTPRAVEEMARGRAPRCRECLRVVPGCPADELNRPVRYDDRGLGLRRLLTEDGELVGVAEMSRDGQGYILRKVLL